MKIDLTELLFQKSRLSEVQEEFNSTFSNLNSELEDLCSNIKSTSLTAANQKIKDALLDVSADLNKEMATLTEFMTEQLKGYEVTHDEVVESLKKLVDMINGTFTENGSIVVKQPNVPVVPVKPITPVTTPVPITPVPQPVPITPVPQPAPITPVPQPMPITPTLQPGPITPTPITYPTTVRVNPQPHTTITIGTSIDTDI